jgi:REP element-mobilizing transposase RayT
MSHTYCSALFHCVFSTKSRRAIIPPDLQDRLWPYMAGIARMNRFKALAAGGMPDHAHVLLSLTATMPIAKAVQLIKGGSSKWINDHLRGRGFAWQDAYAAFSIGISQVEKTVRYIDNQERHHKRMTAADELERMLERHGITPRVDSVVP